jgi:hypothetical protein
VTAEVCERDGYIAATHWFIAVWVTAKVMKSVGYVVATYGVIAVWVGDR